MFRRFARAVRESPEHPRLLAALFALLHLALVVPVLDLCEIGGSSEAREVHVAALIRQQGEVVLPLRNGAVPSKPLLLHWIGAAQAALRGVPVTPAAMRGISAAAGAGVVALTVLLALRFRRTTPPQARLSSGYAALLAWAGLESLYQFPRLSADARVDMLFTFFVTLAVYSLLRRVPSEHADEREPSGFDWVLFYGAAACAVLSKGPLGVVLPVLVCGVSFAWLQGYARTARMFLRPRWAWLLFLCLALPWYVLAAFQGKDGFVGRQLIFENFRRFVGGEQVNHEVPWFYVRSFLFGAAPLSFLFVWYVVAALRTRPRAEFGYSEESRHAWRVRAIPAVWFLSGFVLFSLASGKRHSYLAPLLPAVALALSYFIPEAAVRLSSRSIACLRGTAEALRRNLWLLGVAIAVLCSVLSRPLAVPAGAADMRLYLTPFLARFEILLAVMLVLWRVLRRRRYAHWIASLMLFFGSFYWSFWLGLAGKNHLKGYPRLAAELREAVGGAPLTVVKDPFDESYDSLLYYYGLPVAQHNPIQPQPAGSRRYLVSVKLAQDLEKLGWRLRPVRSWSPESSALRKDHSLSFELADSTPDAAKAAS